jgi:hypothetical protein
VRRDASLPPHRPSFIRFDLNPPGHPNEERELRAHLHPGCDDLLLPSLILEPLEALELMLTPPIVEK